MPVRWESDIGRFRDTETGRFVSSVDALPHLRTTDLPGIVMDPFGNELPIERIRLPVDWEVTLPSGDRIPFKITGPDIEYGVTPFEDMAWGRLVIFEKPDGTLGTMIVQYSFGTAVLGDELDRVIIHRIAKEWGVEGDEEYSSEELQGKIVASYGGVVGL